ncbi:4-(cytidine 5'-diphospho)-2-C-methyl-D-erythritol kinase [Shimia sp.]|uniref:4-(cytidine 5'-diphospho)-2-C-methyl-D-erythritol kinase n=1 Tax=Shimia sp. TaxID=1954381 RepID=UPI003562B9D9
MTVEVFAPAKINLTLHVTGQRDDGYHLLDSLVVFAEIGDTVAVAPADKLSLAVTGPEAAGLDAGPGNADNLVLRAARLFDDPRGARITLTKRLPVSSGIGGGSSDAAATLRALARHWQAPLPAPGRCLSLGADIPVCMAPGAQRMQGIGETLSRIDGLPEMEILLVNPRVAVSTPGVFRALTRKTNPAMAESLPRWAGLGDFTAWLQAQRNDLMPPALHQQPVIGEVLAALRASGSLNVGMSGSGATCFGLFPPDGRAAEAARRALSAASHGQWWCAAGPVLA